MIKRLKYFFAKPSCKVILLLIAAFYYLDNGTFVRAKNNETDKVFVQTPNMRTETIFLVRFLEELHLCKKPISKIKNSELIGEFLTTLDPQKMILSEQDYQYFVKTYGMSLDLLLRGGSLTPAFEMFKYFQKKAVQRMNWIQKRLSGTFCFKRDTFYKSDRKNAEWPKSSIELDQLWELRLKHELLNEILATQDENLFDLEPTSVKDKKEDLEENTVLQQLPNAKKSLTEQYETIKTFWDKIEPVDVQEVFSNTLTNFYDPHTTFFSADSMEDFSISLHNSLVGIGAYLHEENGFCTIKELLPGGPAEQIKTLHPGDKILAVAQGDDAFVNIQGMKIRHSVKYIRGPKGTKVRLLIQPFDGEPAERKEISLIRDEIKLTRNLASAKIYTVEDSQNHYHRIGIIDLPTFYGAEDSNEKSETHSLSQDVKMLLQSLKAEEVEGIILDLRRNTGGLLQEATKLVGLFVPHCPVVKIRDSSNNITSLFAETNDTIWDGPLLLLTSHFSASATEIVAGALQACRRAFIFGDKTTHGKGSVQAVIEMDRMTLFPQIKNRLGAAKITVQKWYLPNGSSTQRHGIESDIWLESIYDYLPLSENDLPTALAWDAIPPMKEFKNNVSNKWLPQGLNQYLLQNQHLRQNQQKAFSWYQQQLHYCKEKFQQKVFPLNLHERFIRLKQDRETRLKLSNQAKTLAKGNLPYKKINLQDVTEKDNKPNTSFDLQERESLQMMADWLQLKDEGQKYSLFHGYLSPNWNHATFF